MPSTVEERLIRTKQRPTSTGVLLVEIPHRAGRQTRAKTKVKWGVDSRREPQTAVAGSKLAPATGRPGAEMEQTAAAAEAAIAWATEAYRRAREVVALGTEAVPLAEPRVEGGGAARERAVHGVPPVWAVPGAAPAAVAGGGGNQT